MKLARWFMALDRAELTGVLLLFGFLFALSGTPLGIAIALSPEEIERGGIPLSRPCVYQSETGRPCTTCGMSRAFSALSRGQLERARRLNPASPWVFAGFVVIALGSATLLALSLQRLARSKTSAAL